MVDTSAHSAQNTTYVHKTTRHYAPPYPYCDVTPRLAIGRTRAAKGSMGHATTFGIALHRGNTKRRRTCDPEKEVDISLLWGVWRLLQSRYIDVQELNTQQLVYGAVRGLVSAVGDPYTGFMTPRENTDFRDALSGHLQGIGAELTQREDVIVVVAPIKGAPADKAGLLPEDIILTVDGEDITGMTLNEVVGKIRGPRGTAVTLEVLREGRYEPMSIKITRDDITVPSAEYEVKKTATGSVGYLTINQFGSETIKEVQSLLTNVQQQSLKGFIVDVRFNGGGYLEGAVDLTSMFLKEGKVVDVVGRDTEPQHHMVTGKTILPDIPLVILVNEGSASASEIFAGALQDQDRAIIVGKQTFGKGTVQEVVDLPGGSSLRVTIAKWLTPAGKDLGKEGVTPDVEVDRTREDVEAGRDPQLEKALEVVTEQQ